MDTIQALLGTLEIVLKLHKSVNWKIPGYAIPRGKIFLD